MKIYTLLLLLITHFFCFQIIKAQSDRGVMNVRIEQKVALVIGNSNYTGAPLKNPVNDAADIANALVGFGFEVIHRENLNQNEMKRAIREFGTKIKGGAIGLFYFAGHGVQVKGANYLIPIGANVNNEEEVEYEAVDVGFVLAQMESAQNQMNIVILDACRNNPFARSFRSVDRGLAQINAPSGTLIAYATAPGSVASDGTSRNGLYTQELLKNMRTPNLSVEEIFKRVRISVRNQTQDKQTPWESSSLTGSFIFNKNSDPNQNNSGKTASDVDVLFWQSIKDSSDPQEFKEYLKQFPNGRFAKIAQGKALIFTNDEGDKVEVLGFNPTTPLSFYLNNNQDSSQKIKIKIAYKLKSLASCYIFISTTKNTNFISTTKESMPGYIFNNGSYLIASGEGFVEKEVGRTSPGTIDQIQINMISEDRNKTLLSFVINVKATWQLKNQ